MNAQNIMGTQSSLSASPSLCKIMDIHTKQHAHRRNNFINVVIKKS